ITRVPLEPIGVADGRRQGADGEHLEGAEYRPRQIPFRRKQYGARERAAAVGYDERVTLNHVAQIGIELRRRTRQPSGRHPEQRLHDRRLDARLERRGPTPLSAEVWSGRGGGEGTEEPFVDTRDRLEQRRVDPALQIGILRRV